MPIEWNDSLKTGIPIIDEQHQELIVMMNRIGRFKCGKESLFEALIELEEYANVHFKTEEDFMISMKYPEYQEHKSCHDKFAEDLKKFQERINTTKNLDELGCELHDFAIDWLINHYSTEDIKLIKYIKNYS